MRKNLNSDEYVRIKKSDWKNILNAYSWAKSREKMLDVYEDAIVRKEEDIGKLQIFKRSAERFLSEAGLLERFYEFIEPKSVKKELEKKRKEVEAKKESFLYSKWKKQQKEIEHDI